MDSNFFNNSEKGNYWVGFSDSCEDLNSNGICDSTFSINIYTDYFPLSVEPGYFVLNDSQFFGEGTKENPYLIPGCKILNESGYYKLSNDLLIDSALESCLVVDSNDVILDFNGYGIDCSLGNCVNGLKLTNVSNIEILNGSIKGINLNSGVFIDGNSNVSFSDFISLETLNYAGFYVKDSFDLTFERVVSNNSYSGIFVENSSYILIKDSNFSNNSFSNLYYVSGENLVLENVLGEDNLPILIFSESVNISNWDNNFSQLIFVDTSDIILQNITYNQDLISNLLYFRNVSNVGVYNVSISTNSLSLLGVVFVSFSSEFEFVNLDLNCLDNSDSIGLKLIDSSFTSISFSNFSNCNSAISQENLSYFSSLDSVFKNNVNGLSFDSGPFYFFQTFSGLSFFETKNPFAFNVVAPTLFYSFNIFSPTFNFLDTSVSNLFFSVSEPFTPLLENSGIYFSLNYSDIYSYPLIFFNDFTKENIPVLAVNLSVEDFEYGDNYFYLDPIKFENINVINGSAEIYFSLKDSGITSPNVSYNGEVCLPSRCFEVDFYDFEREIFYLKVSSVLGNYSFSQGRDIYSPRIFNLENFTFYEDEEVLILLDLWDNVEIDRVWVNDSRFVIDEDFVLTTNRTLGIGTYWINLSLKDASGNFVSQKFFIEVIKKIEKDVYSGSSKVVYRITKEDLEKNKLSRSLSSSDVLRLIYPERIYTLEGFNLDNINNKVSIIISGGVIDGSFILEGGKSKKVDLNNDGYYDLILRLISVSSTHFRIMLEATNEKVNYYSSLTENIISPITNPTINLGGDSSNSNKNSSIPLSLKDRTAIFFVLIGFLIFLICLLVLLIILRYKNQKENYFYV